MRRVNLIIIFPIALLILAACTGARTGPTSGLDGGASDQAAAAAPPGQDAMSSDGDAAHEGGVEDGVQDAMSSNGDAAHEGGVEDGVTEEKAEEVVEEGAAIDDEEAGESITEMAGLPAWQQLALTDARTGETFTLADYSGQTVFVEPMATWCTNCRRQLGNVRDARAQIGEDAVFIGLSLETNISAAELAQYQSDFGFDWTFAVMSPEILQEMADTFGRSITSAPSTPHFIIRPDGSYTDLVTGIESAEQIVRQLQDARG